MSAGQGEATFIKRIQNAGASLLLLTLTYGAYSLAPHFQNYLAQELELLSHAVTSGQVLRTAYLIYALLLIIYYLAEPSPRISKSVYCLQALATTVRSPLRAYRVGLTTPQRLGLLTVALKAFFAPLMFVWLVDHATHMISNGYYLISNMNLVSIDFLAVFNAQGFWFLFQAILFLDVFFFTIGYLVELPILRNEIRSVDPTVLGWAVALACYPPLNGLTAYVLAWQPTDFPQFADPVIHVGLNGLLLALMAVYTSASVALNFKASNLTHRGIVAVGPYRVVRHPAYACKNLAWWIGATPALYAGFQTSLHDALVVAASLGGWTLIYALRAFTEENHLRSVDQEYDRYCQKVRYRFIPGVL